MSCHVMSCYVMSCHVTPRHVTSCHVMSCHAMPCHVMSCHVTSRHVMSCHVTSCQVMLCHGRGSSSEKLYPIRFQVLDVNFPIDVRVLIVSLFQIDLIVSNCFELFRIHHHKKCHESWQKNRNAYANHVLFDRKNDIKS